MEVLEIPQKSLISQEIRDLLLDSSPASPSDSNGGFICADFTLNWPQIAELCEPTEDLSYENCKRIIPLHRKVWSEAQHILWQETPQESSRNIPKNLYSWTCRSDFVERILDSGFLGGSSSASCSVEVTLVLSSVIEYALGNVFSTISGKIPPHLLRDVLMTQELEEIFSRESLFFLKILMGTPNGINLRNIVWHGFPTPQEIPFYFPCTLLLVIFSLGKILNEKNLQVLPRKIPYNPVEMIEREIILDMPWKCFKNEEILEFMRDSGFISSEHLQFWEEILESYWRGNYASGIILFLPQFELILRRIYGEVNEVDVVARIGSYYIILDTFMEELLPDSERINQIHKIFDPGILHLIHDLFIAPKGPRIRDKISHGELSLEEINDEKVLGKLITLGLGVLSQMLKMHPMGDFSSPLLGYRSQFHPNGRLLIDLHRIQEQLRQFSCIEIPKDLHLENFPPENPFLEKSLNAGELKIFFRPTEEAEIVGILSKVLKNALCAATNFHTGLEERLSMFQAKLLRSKRRETLLKCLQLVPKIHSWLLNLSQMVEKVFIAVQQCPEASEAWNRIPQEKLKRLLRKIQKYSENLTQTTQISTNDWMKSFTVVEKSVEVFGKVSLLLNHQ